MFNFHAQLTAIFPKRYSLSVKLLCLTAYPSSSTCFRHNDHVLIETRKQLGKVRFLLFASLGLAIPGLDNQRSRNDSMWNTIFHILSTNDSLAIPGLDNQRSRNDSMWNTIFHILSTNDSMWNIVFHILSFLLL